MAKKQTVGFVYYMAMHMGICRGPIDELVSITVGGRPAWQKPTSGANPLAYDPVGAAVLIERDDLFGGAKREGGIDGWFELFFGSQEQAPNDPPPWPSWGGAAYNYFPGDTKPNYRGVVTAFYEGQVCANNPYPKKWGFRARRILNGWDGDVFRPDLATLHITTGGLDIKAMNPAHIIWECLTNRVWGRGLPSGMLDIASFTVAANWLLGEGFGMCLRWARTDEISTFVQHILDHIGGSLFVKRSTGLLTLRLIRGDYEPESLPLYDTSSGILEITEATVASPTTTINEVVVEYRDPMTNAIGTVRVANIASIQQTGGVLHSVKREYLGLPTASLAQRVAQRDLRAMADGLRKFVIKFDRRVWDIEPGGLIRIQDTSRGILPTVLRVGKIEDGTLQSGTMTLYCVQDVFSMPAASFISDQPSQWEPPVTVPCSPDQAVFEIPYVILARTLSPAELGALTDESSFLGTVAAPASALSVSYDIAVRAGAPEEEDWPVGDDTFCGYVRPPGAPGG